MQLTILYLYTIKQIQHNYYITYYIYIIYYIIYIKSRK